jgi:hypothetical protein
MLDAHQTSGSLVIEDDKSVVLQQIRRPDCQAAIWQRNHAPIFAQWLDALRLEDLESARVTAYSPTLEKAVANLCQLSGIPQGRGRSLLISDIVSLAEVYMGATQTSVLNLRLDVVSGNACHKFHQDYVTARLLCTYRGAGTQFGQSHGNQAPEDVHQMAEGHVGLFRGRLWSSGGPDILLHRSPPIEGSGERRLLLVIDAHEED